MDHKRETMDMVNGPLFKNILSFSVPLVFSNILQIFFNSADTIIVGRFAGDKALAAVGATGSIVFLITSIFNGLATGTNVVVSRYIGTGRAEKVRKAVHTSMDLAILGGIILTFVGIAFARTFLQMMSTPESFIDLSATYMRIYFGGVIFLMIYDFGAAVLRSKGDTRRPLYFLLLSGALNIILNFITVRYLNLSVVGVASATCASQALSAFLVMHTLLMEKDAARLDLKALSFDQESLFEIMRIGIPAGLSGAVFALSNVVIQTSINSFDSTDIVAGNSAGANIENYVFIGYTAFNQAAITFTSQCMGARRFDRVRQIMIKTMLMVIVCAGLLGAFVYFSGPFLLSLYTNKPEVVAVGMVRIKIVASLLVINGMLDTAVNSLRGMGSSTLPTVVMVIGICGIRLAWIYTVFPLYRTLEMIYYCFPISWTFTLAVELILWRIVYKHISY